ncbi:MAG: guanine deaminase [Oceanospirillaceae bacterium]|nr:guanine deaminase [Oceanospirillaceae bacterium]MAR01554.1 guanine deaminase [Oceanospirillaceae bacterium]|tara:strand:+ start:1959 stop:3254 length:1296 start_codon:yes stop_codon:yes gene_type:complete
MSIKIHTGQILHFLSAVTHEYFPSGALVTEDGKVVTCGDKESLLARYPQADITDHGERLIMPGMIDSHVHYPQLDVIASYGEQLLDWLNNYTFPAENAFKDPETGRSTAQFFLNELLKNGTTTAMVYGTVHPQSVDAFFEQSSALNTRMLCGKVMMDRNAPEYLCDTAESSQTDSQALIDRWHKKGRQLYVVTPRFAITSTPEQLTAAGQLLKDNPDVYLQTHLAENKAEIAFVEELFPERKGYLDVYAHYGLLGPRSTFGHCVHLDDQDLKIMSDTGSRIAFCPTSNLFLGSGLFRLHHQPSPVSVSIASDVGGGTSLSMLQTLNEAYKICQLNGTSLSPLEAFYRVTLGNAESLLLDDRIGNFTPGKEADFIVLNPAGTPLMERRSGKCTSLEELLFCLMIMGDDRAVAATYVMGNCLWNAMTDNEAKP